MESSEQKTKKSWWALSSFDRQTWWIDKNTQSVLTEENTFKCCSKFKWHNWVKNRIDCCALGMKKKVNLISWSNQLKNSNKWSNIDKKIDQNIVEKIDKKIDKKIVLIP